jgi:hypothetical protein
MKQKLDCLNEVFHKTKQKLCFLKDQKLLLEDQKLRFLEDLEAQTLWDNCEKKYSQTSKKLQNMMKLVTLEQVYVHLCSDAFRYRIGVLGPVFDLFFWNVLQNQRDLAFELWKHVEYPERSAICASYMLRKMAKDKNTEPMARDKMLENANFFEEKATLVLQAAEDDDRELAASSLDCDLLLWRGMSLMDVAVQCECFRVLETGCFKEAINSRLYGDLSPYGNDTLWGQLKLMFFTLTFGFFPAFFPWTIQWAPPPVSECMRRSTQRRVTPEGYPNSPSLNPTLRKLKDKLRKKGTSADLLDKPDNQIKDLTKRELEKLWEPTFGIIDRLGCFLSSPYVLFALNCFMTIIVTLGFTVWFLRMKLDPSNYSVDIQDNVTVEEIILMVYFGGCLVREVGQIFILKLQYLCDGWNVPEMLSLASFFVAFWLRSACTQSSDCKFTAFVTITSLFYSLSLFFCWMRMLRIFCLSKLGITIGIFFSMMTTTALFWVLYFILLFALSMLFVGTSDLDTLIPGHATCGNSTSIAKGDWQIAQGDLPDGELPENGYMECSWTFVILRPMFQSFGEFGSFFPQMTNPFNVVFLILTYISLNLVGLNLLIAMMSSTYEKVSKRAQTQSWVYTYALVQEYTQRSMASPPPLNVIFLMLDLILFCWHYKRIWDIYPDYTLGQRLDRFLARNEDMAKAERVRGAITNSNKQNAEDRRVQANFSAFMEHARQSVMNKELSKDSMEGKLDSIASAIKHMQGMQDAICLQGKGKAAGVKEEASTDFKSVKQREREKLDRLRTKFSDNVKKACSVTWGSVVQGFSIHTHTHTHIHTYIIHTHAYTHTNNHARTRTCIFTGEVWKRKKDKLKASLAPLSRQDLVKSVAEVLQLVEDPVAAPDNPKQENYSLTASLASLSRKDLIERVAEVLETRKDLIERVAEVLETTRYSINKHGKLSRYLRGEVHANSKDEVAGEESSDLRRTGGEVAEHGGNSRHPYPFEKWDVNEVYGLFKSIGFAEAADAIKENCVDGQTLISVDFDQYLTMGIAEGGLGLKPMQIERLKTEFERRG